MKKRRMARSYTVPLAERVERYERDSIGTPETFEFAPALRRSADYTYRMAVEPSSSAKRERPGHYTLTPRQIEDAMICLSCTEEECTGTRGCFLRHKEAEGKEKN